MLVAGAATGLAAMGLSACGDDEASDDGVSAPDPSLTYELLVAFPRDLPYVAAGVPQRLPFLIGEEGDAPLDTLAGPVEFRISDSSGVAVGEPIEVAAHGEGLARAYLPLRVSFEEPGIYTVTATYAGQELPREVQAFPVDQVSMPGVGSPLPAVATPTIADARGVAPICTREPACAFHEHELTASLAGSRPVALQISTPRYCRTSICGPVLDLLVEQVESDPDLARSLDVIHAEVYANPEAVDSIEQATPAPVMSGLSLQFEPILYVADATGTIVDRLDSIWDRAELDAALAAAV